MSDSPLEGYQRTATSVPNVSDAVDEEGSKAFGLTPTGTSGSPPVAEASEQRPIDVAHVAEPNKRYPGETVRLYTHVRVRNAVEGFTLRVQIPPELVVENYESTLGQTVPDIEVGTLPPDEAGRLQGMTPGSLVHHAVANRPEQYLVWRISEAQEADDEHEFVITAYVQSLYRDMSVRSRAAVYLGAGHETTKVSEETVQISIMAKGGYLAHLPALYEQDDFIGRFLMLFESFWRPLDKQIDSIHNVFDPQLTPVRFLPWLASWFDLALDENWTEAQQRRLLSVIMKLYRKRGTRSSLREWLEIFSGHQVEIHEHRSNNFRLGQSARLGASIALGTGNTPHTFSVHVTLDPVQVSPEYADEDFERERERLEGRQRRQIIKIIEAEKPAHTRYNLAIRRLIEDTNGADNSEDLRPKTRGEVH